MVRRLSDPIPFGGRQHDLAGVIVGAEGLRFRRLPVVWRGSILLYDLGLLIDLGEVGVAEPVLDRLKEPS